MDAETFVDNFATIADATDGVQRLRDLALDLAVSGRLVEQDPADEPAAGLLEQIEADMAKACAEGHSKPNRAHQPRQPGRPLPSSWCWAYVPQLGFVNPKNQVDGETVAGFIPMPLVPTDTREPVRYEERKWSEISRGYTHVADGDVALAKITPCFQNGKSGVIAGLPSGVGAATTELFVIRPTEGGVNPKYLHLFFSSPSYLRGGVPEMTGTAGQQRLPREYFTDTPVPLPPLAEQERIVARVDEVMGLCDELEARQKRRHRAATLFRRSALHALTEAPTTLELRQAWSRINANWAWTADHLDNMPGLRHTIVSLAVRGRLTMQDARDESAEHLLERIAQGALVEASSATAPMTENDEPWQLPSAWRWARLKQIADFAAGRTPPTKDPTFWSATDGYHWVAIGDMPDGGEIHETARRVTDRAATEIFRQQPDPAGTLLMSFKLTIGKVARLAVPAFHNEAIIAIRTPFDETNEYLFRTLPLLTKGGTTKAAVMGNTLNKASLTNLLIPLPPLGEQARLVSTMDNLLHLCDELEEALGATANAASAAAHGLTARIALGHNN